VLGRIQLQDGVMTQKEIVMEAVRELPDDAAFREIADRIEFLAGIQSGLDQLDRGQTVVRLFRTRRLSDNWLHGLPPDLIRPYRIIYRVVPASESIEVVRIWHGARGEPQTT
jgi:plasmid stabilization system protein ParE